MVEIVNLAVWEKGIASMPDDISKLVTPDILTGVARQYLKAAEAELLDWEMTPVSHEAVIETTGGLYRLHGNAQVRGERLPWSAVLKMVRAPEERDAQTEQSWDYWKREMLVYQSGLLETLPDGLRGPSCFGVSETPDGGWIWMEDMVEAGDPTWTIAQYHQAARRLGQLAGAYGLGKPLPAHPWLCSSLFRGFRDDREWWAKFINPQSANNAWQRSVVEQIFPEPDRLRVLQIWAEKDQLIMANENLPQVFCHNDTHRKNLMWVVNAEGKEELVGIDWAYCGTGGLGNDLGELVGTSLSYFAIEPESAQELETAVYEGYCAGLKDAGWAGNDRLAWLGYLLSLTLWWGATLPVAAADLQPGAARYNVEAKYGRSAGDVVEGWKTFAAFLLSRADETRFWLKQLQR